LKLTKERIFVLTLDVKDPDTPFKVERSVSVESGDLTYVLSNFPLKLVQLLRELEKEDSHDMGADDDIPF
jgi:hypothetical protein